MKKIFLSILTGIIISFFNNVLAKDIIPNTPTLVNVHTVGLYQVGNDVTIYKFPDDNSQILYRVRWNSDEFSLLI